MEKLTFNTTIDAPTEKVWEILWGKESYKQWTTVFAEGSDAETDWQEGSKVIFSDGKGMGMVSRIERNIPNEYMSIKHLGFYKDGVEDTESEETKSWAGAMENYTLTTVDGKTKLDVEVNVSEKEKGYFLETFPKALAKVKELAEVA